MELQQIREKRNELESTIEQLILQFTQDTDVEIAEIRLQPPVYSPVGDEYKIVTPVKVDIELVI